MNDLLMVSEIRSEDGFYKIQANLHHKDGYYSAFLSKSDNFDKINAKEKTIAETDWVINDLKSTIELWLKSKDKTVDFEEVVEDIPVEHFEGLLDVINNAIELGFYNEYQVVQQDYPQESSK